MYLPLGFPAQKLCRGNSDEDNLYRTNWRKFPHLAAILPTFLELGSTLLLLRRTSSRARHNRDIFGGLALLASLSRGWTPNIRTFL